MRNLVTTLIIVCASTLLLAGCQKTQSTPEPTVEKFGVRIPAEENIWGFIENTETYTWARVKIYSWHLKDHGLAWDITLKPGETMRHDVGNDQRFDIYRRKGKNGWVYEGSIYTKGVSAKEITWSTP